MVEDLLDFERIDIIHNRVICSLSEILDQTGNLDSEFTSKLIAEFPFSYRNNIVTEIFHFISPNYAKVLFRGFFFLPLTKGDVQW